MSKICYNYMVKVSKASGTAFNCRESFKKYRKLVKSDIFATLPQKISLIYSLLKL